MTYHDYLIAEIQKLKQSKNAVILSHYYQLPEIQEIADHVGDSFALSKLASSLPNDLIVFCGVDFMAESAKLLSPGKTVILPVEGASCPMANMASASHVQSLRDQYPDAAVVSYVNSTTDVKALSDICCTSGNAIRVIRSLPNKQIIFVPDSGLGTYAASLIPEKEFILFNGFCPPHKDASETDVLLAREAHPEAKLLIHPECGQEVRKHADFIGSTAQIINYVANSNHRCFLIGTEEGILHPLTQKHPEKEFHMLTRHFICRDMKKITAAHLLRSLQTMEAEVHIHEDLASKARISLQRMLEVTCLPATTTLCQ